LKKRTLELGLPWILTVLVFAADQISKELIVRYFPLGSGRIEDVFGNSLLWICHVRNKAVAFSLGAGLPERVRGVVFVALPILLIILLAVWYFKSREITQAQRWLIAGIAGGGLGNLFDRIFRSEGVVDFISVKFFGIFGFERWPTFNIADSSVVVCVIVWFITLFWTGKDYKEEE
jgi:signal peptidase II